MLTTLRGLCFVPRQPRGAINLGNETDGADGGAYAAYACEVIFCDRFAGLKDISSEKCDPLAHLHSRGNLRSQTGTTTLHRR